MKILKIKRKWLTYFFLLLSTLVVFFLIYFLIKEPIITNYSYDSQILNSTPSSESKLLESHVKILSEQERTTKEELDRTIKYILEVLHTNGIDEKNIEIQKYYVAKREYQNIIVHFITQARKYPNDVPKYIIGAHYDSFGNLPGADDNASAIAGILELSRMLTEVSLVGRDIDLVFYSTEEPPFFGTENMGSFVHAKSIEKENIKLVIILEMIGYYSEKENSQDFPMSILKTIYPNKGNFIAIASNFSNIAEIRKVKKRFNSYLKTNNLINAESINAPNLVTGLDFSDHRNYWKFDIPAIMVTDTAFYRNKNYHTKNDTYEKLDYEKMKEVVNATLLTALSL